MRKDERRYYEELLKYSRDHLMLYPYHLSDIMVKGLRVTPFSYYIGIMEVSGSHCTATRRLKGIVSRIEKSAGFLRKPFLMNVSSQNNGPKGAEQEFFCTDCSNGLMKVPIQLYIFFYIIKSFPIIMKFLACVVFLRRKDFIRHLILVWSDCCRLSFFCLHFPASLRPLTSPS